MCVQVIGRLHALAEEAAATLAPIARPMWWLDPVRKPFHTCEVCKPCDLLVVPSRLLQ